MTRAKSGKSGKSGKSSRKSSISEKPSITADSSTAAKPSITSKSSSDKPWPYAAGYDNTPEVLEPAPLTVKGTIPPWLEGALYRSGPGYEIQKGGRVSYRSRYTSNDLRERYKKAEAITGVTFCQRDPCKTAFQKFFTTFKMAAFGGPKMGGTDTNVAVIPTINFPGLMDDPDYKKKKGKAGPRNLVMTTDGNALQELDPITLEPLRLFSYGAIDDSLNASNLAPAHPCVDPDTNEYFTVLLTFGPTALYKVVRIRQSIKGPEYEPDLDVLAEITSPRPTYMHSFCMTKRYVVVCHWQCDFAASGVSVLWYGNAWESFKSHDPNVKASFYVVDRHQGRHVATFEADPYYAFHTINSFDDDGDIVLDIAAYKDHTVIGDYYIENLRNETGGKPPQQAMLRRYRLRNIAEQAALSYGKKGQPQPVPAQIDFQLDESVNFELPSINPSRYLRNYRYAYGVNRSGMNKTLIYDRIIKVDLDKIKSGAKHSSSATFWMEDQCTPSEPVFVPTPNSTEEDDGVLLSIVLDGRRRTGFMLILDAKTMKEIARAEMPEGTVAPHNFHGVYVPNSVAA
ncbi:hypothetical protein BGZ80_008999 [Entomortierella chlamydospora]|uniref:Carotenoid oxygenase n=1 Tax=Entomortierella chlamydospora TaxID=101097 RepID=A0A9P6N3L2_9FUNG|nr:hypothetical protein BGZ79_001602 [Entomortierella chlamydospora]KAG0023566.1 hypothetical protein BGZ80_008999 [Entomortierella chlamydospora]